MAYCGRVAHNSVAAAAQYKVGTKFLLVHRTSITVRIHG